MSQFYVSIIFLGIMLITVSIVLIAFDKKKSIDYVNELDSKKQELVGIISDAEQMIEEMNKFSDYIVTQMDFKSDQLSISLKNFEKEIGNLKEKADIRIDASTFLSDKVVNGGYAAISKGYENQASEYRNINSEYDGIDIDSTDNNNLQFIKQNSRFKIKETLGEKVIPMNAKYRKVIQLSQNGLEDTEIAKCLNMGKGEVQLIIETCRQA